MLLRRRGRLAEMCEDLSRIRITSKKYLWATLIKIACHKIRIGPHSTQWCNSPALLVEYSSKCCDSRTSTGADEVKLLPAARTPDLKLSNLGVSQAKDAGMSHNSGLLKRRAMHRSFHQLGSWRFLVPLLQPGATAGEREPTLQTWSSLALGVTLQRSLQMKRVSYRSKN